MIKIVFPAKKPSIKIVAGKEMIFCSIRKRWMVITPEEWVRQNFLLYLNEVLGYPLSLIAVEKQLIFGDVKKRFDIVVYGKDSRPLIIVECKEMNVVLDEKTLQQALRYNISVKARYLIITNGSYCAAFANDAGSFSIAEKIPSWDDNDSLHSAGF